MATDHASNHRCSAAGCSEPAVSRRSGSLLCTKHQSSFDRHNPDAPRCSFEPCDRPVYAKGLCTGHNQQRLKGKELKPLQKKYSATPCSVAGCLSRAVQFNSGDPLCNRHYTAWKRHGAPGKLTQGIVTGRGMDAIREAVATWDRSQCWEAWANLSCWDGLDGWGGKSDDKGYPKLGAVRVMHLSMEADGRPRPAAPNNHGLHSCDNKACWNPDHLRWGTRADNIRDYHGRWGHCSNCPHCNPSLASDDGDMWW